MGGVARSKQSVGCTERSHEELKSDDARWDAELDPVGEIDVGDGSVVLLANCRACRSTLAVYRAAKIS